MCFIVTGYFNKIEKKKKSHKNLTITEFNTFFNKVLKDTGIGKRLEMLNEHANPKSFTQRMNEDKLENKFFREKI